MAQYKSPTNYSPFVRNSFTSWNSGGIGTWPGRPITLTIARRRVAARTLPSRGHPPHQIAPFRPFLYSPGRPRSGRPAPASPVVSELDLPLPPPHARFPIRRAKAEPPTEGGVARAPLICPLGALLLPRALPRVHVRERELASYTLLHVWDHGLIAPAHAGLP